MKDIAYYNGQTSSISDMKIPMLDRAVYFGDGVYDVAYVHCGVAFALDDHIDRFIRSCSLIRIEPPMGKDELRDTLNDLIAKVDPQEDGGDCVLYFQASRGTADRNHPFPEGAKANLMAYVKPVGKKPWGGELKLITLPDTRFLHCNIKTITLIPAVMASQKAAEAGCDEAVLHRRGRVTECAHSNVMILLNGRLRTAPTDNLILPGITRKHLVELAPSLGIPVIEEPFTIGEMMRADEVIVTSSTAFMRRATEIDGSPVGGRDAATYERLREQYYRKYIRETEGK